MQIVWNTFNHNEIGRRSLEDIIFILKHQMNALGHDAKWIPDNKLFAGAGNGVNIVIEGFSPWSIEAMAQARLQGARFLILATEEPTYRGNAADPGSWESMSESSKALYQASWVGFNHGTQAEMVKRQKIFPEAAKHCDGILHLVPGEHVTRWYSQFAPAAYADLGYARTLVRPDAIQPEFDFGFYGSLTPRRLKILKRLAKMIGTQKAVKLVVDFKTQDERDREMQRAKVIVQVRKFEEMGLVSSSRCATALSIGRPVVAEPHDLCKPWDEVVTFAKTMDGFYSAALMARSAWRGIHAAQFAKFKEKMSPEICIGRALEHVGIETPCKMAA